MRNAQAHVLLRELFPTVRIESAEEIGEIDAPTRLTRLELAGSNAPDTVVVKESRDGSTLDYSERTSYDFFGLLKLEGVFTPKVFGSSQSGSCLVLEDLGNGQVGQILCGDDRRLAVRALHGLVRTAGRLHSATAGKAELFESVRKQYPAGVQSRHRVHRIVEALDGLPEQFRLIGLEFSDAALDELEKSKREILQPLGFFALTHGDLTPANTFFHNGEVRLIDFETTAFRHALLDGAYARLRYLHSVWAQRIPRELQKELDEGYRSELSKTIPETANAAIYGRGLLACALGWFAGLASVLDEVMCADKTWGLATYRQRVFVGAEHFVQLCEEFGDYSAVCDQIRDVLTTLKQSWPVGDCDMPLYPALAAPS